MKIVDEKNRNSLIEGRSKGFGQAFAKEIDNNVIETIMPISACKDYLNDQLYTFHTGKQYSAYGFTSIQIDNYLDKDYFFMVGKVLPYRGSFNNGYKDIYFERDKEYLSNNRDGMLAFINQIETKLKFDLTEIIDCENDFETVIFKVPIEWSYNLYSISLYGLICRISLWYQYEDIKTYLKNFNYDSGDAFAAKRLLEDINKLKKYLYKPFNVPKNINIHSAGYRTFLSNLKK